MRSTNVWLTDEELERIITYVPKNANEQLVRTQFLIGAFTGCRHSDYTRLNNRNIVGGMISYVSLKTKTHATVPLKPIVKELLTNLPKKKLLIRHSTIISVIFAGKPESQRRLKYSRPERKWKVKMGICFKPHGTPEFCNQFVFTRCRFILNKPNDGTCKRGNDSKLSLLWSP